MEGRSGRKQMAMTGSWGITGVGEKPGIEGGANCRENLVESGVGTW